MTESIRSYLLSLVSVGFIEVVVQSVLPPGAVKRAAAAVCGLLMILTVIKPLAELDLEKLSFSIAQIDVMETTAISNVEIDNQSIIAAIIKENTESYILDKAAEFGIEPVRITADVVCDGGHPYPSRVLICGEYTDSSKRRLSVWIANELAIEPKNQEWVWNKGNG